MKITLGSIIQMIDDEIKDHKDNMKKLEDIYGGDVFMPPYDAGYCDGWLDAVINVRGEIIKHFRRIRKREKLQKDKALGI